MKIWRNLQVNLRENNDFFLINVYFNFKLILHSAEINEGIPEGTIEVIPGEIPEGIPEGCSRRIPKGIRGNPMRNMGNNPWKNPERNL